jgi:hypothetical protein
VSQSQYDFRIINDFRLHIKERHDPKTIHYFRLASYILLLALLALSGTKSRIV